MSEIRVCVAALEMDGSMRIVREIPGAIQEDGRWAAQIPDFLRDGEMYLAKKGGEYRMLPWEDHIDSSGYDQEFIYAAGIGRILPGSEG